MRDNRTHFEYAANKNLFNDGPFLTRWSSIAYPKYGPDAEIIWKRVNANVFEEWLNNGDCDHIIYLGSEKLNVKYDLKWSLISNVEVGGQGGTSVLNSCLLDSAIISERSNVSYNNIASDIELKIESDRIRRCVDNIFFRQVYFRLKGGQRSEIKGFFGRHLKIAGERNEQQLSLSLSSHTLKELEASARPIEIEYDLPCLEKVFIRADSATIIGKSKSKIYNFCVLARNLSVDINCDKEINSLQFYDEPNPINFIKPLDVECNSINEFYVSAESGASINLNADEVNYIKMGLKEIDLISISAEKINKCDFILDSVKEIDAQQIRFQYFSIAGADIKEKGSFEGAIFERACDFSARKSADAKHMFKNMMFRKAIFKCDVDFSNRDFVGKLDFRDTRWRGVPKFYGGKLNPDTDFAGATFEIPTAKAPDAAKLSEFERAFRTLKLAMEELRARNDEAHFHRHELIARRRQKASVRWEERWLSAFYDAISSYGQSMVKPLLWWFGLNLTMGGYTWWMAGCAPSYLGHSVWFGFINGLRPFFTSNPAFDRARQLGDLRKRLI